jgi:hypothetical protein
MISRFDAVTFRRADIMLPDLLEGTREAETAAQRLINAVDSIGRCDTGSKPKRIDFKG